MTTEHLGEALKWFNHFYESDSPFAISKLTQGETRSYTYATGEEKDPERYLTVYRAGDDQFWVSSSLGPFSIKF